MLGDGTFTQVSQPRQLVAAGVLAVAAKNVHTVFLKEDDSLWTMGNNTHGELGDGTFSNANRPEQALGPYSQLCIQHVDASAIRFLFTGVAAGEYALSPPSWVLQETNYASSFGSLLFTNSLQATSNQFWRARYVP